MENLILSFNIVLPLFFTMALGYFMKRIGMYDDKVGVAAILISVIVPLFNVLSVFALEIFRGGKIDFKKIIKGVITNPLIIASVIGLTFIYLGIKLPYVIEKTVSDISKVATPLSLILLGGSFKFSEVKNHLKQMIIGVFSKLILVPCIFIPISIYVGFRGIELLCLMIIFAAPTAVSSFTMAQQMDADSELAGQIVVFSSAFCVLTVFIWIFILKQLVLI